MGTVFDQGVESVSPFVTEFLKTIRNWLVPLEQVPEVLDDAIDVVRMGTRRSPSS